MTAALYPCEITHVRAHPTRRALRYRSYLSLVDLDDLPQVPLALRPFARFRSRDHLGDPASSIRANVDAYLARQGIRLVGGQVLMLGHATALGYAFNPLTVFWCHRADGTLAAVIAEVHNTYGQRHVYLPHPDSRGRAEADKDFYVSPFLPVAGRYRLHLPEPAATLRLSVTLHIDGRTVLAASVTGKRRTYTPGDLGAGDRHRLGRAGHPGRRPRRPGHHSHHLTVTVANGTPPRRSCGRRGPGGRATA